MADIFELITGAIIAGLIGLITTEYRWWRERRAQRSWLASGLVVDLKRTLRILEGIPLDTREHVIEGFFALIGSRIPRESGLLYLKNGLFQTHYPEIVKLGPEVADQLVKLYDDLYSLEWAGEFYRSNKEDTMEHYKNNSPDSIYDWVTSSKEHINDTINILESILNERGNLSIHLRRIKQISTALITERSPRPR